MLRDAGREEIRKVALPLWTLLHSTQWPGQPGAFDPIKNGACAIVAHLAYCAVGDDERERKNRAKVVPCRVYQELLAGEPVDFIEALASVDFANVEIVRTRYFVAVIFPAHEVADRGAGNTVRIRLADQRERLQTTRGKWHLVSSGLPPRG